MEFLGVGPLELLAIAIVALIFLGPRDMVKAGRSLGKLMRSIVTSPTWSAIQDTSRSLKTLPNQLMREAGADEIKEDLKGVQADLQKQTAMLKSVKDQTNREVQQELKASEDALSAWTTPPAPAAEPSIAPPRGPVAPPAEVAPPSNPPASAEDTPPTPPADQL
jgi:sec-independent protein translocase protein TatB